MRRRAPPPLTLSLSHETHSQDKTVSLPAIRHSGANVTGQEIPLSSRLVRRSVNRSLLGQLLDDPDLLPQIRALPVPVLRQVILQIGLEDSGELIAMSSPEQLRDLFDEDLWRSQSPGQDDSFDAARFAAWLEILLEAGEDFVVDRLSRFSEDFLVFAFSQLVRVLDTAEITASLGGSDDSGLLDRVLDSELCQELDQYLIVSRLEIGWDAVWSSLLALDMRDGSMLRGVLHRCWLATQEQVERDGGFYAALNDSEMLFEDARAERNDRRAERGYLAPADARAFLALARRSEDSPERDPITRAYFRELKREAVLPDFRGPILGMDRPTPLRGLLAEAGFDSRTSSPLPAKLSLFRQTMAGLLVSDADAHQRVVDELAYLANVLVAGDGSRAWEPAEAATQVLSLCDAGLHALLGNDSRASDAASVQEVVVRWGAVGLFRVAWAARSSGE